MTRDDLPLVQEFMRRTQPVEHVQDPEWVRWQYIENPAGFDVRLCLYRPQDAVPETAPDTGARLVGLSGFLPHRFRIGNRTCRGAFSTSTMVEASHRRRGIGRRFHELRLQDYDFAFSSGQSESNRRVYLSLGFVVCGRYRRLLVQPTRPHLRPTLRGLALLYSWLVFVLVSRANGPRGRRARHDDALHVEVGPAVPEMPPELFDDRFPTPDHDHGRVEAVGPLWDRTHVAWRYASHPYFKYSFATVTRRGVPIGVAVLRQTRTNTILVDVYCRQTDFSDVLRGVASVATPPVTGQFVGHHLARRFRRAGWISFRAGNQLLGKSSDPELHALLQARRWCFFGGDSDVDR